MHLVFTIHFCFFRFACSGFGNAKLDNLLIDPVDMAGTKDDLILPGCEESTLYCIDFTDFFVVSQRTVCDNEAQTGGAMGGRLDVFRSADGQNDFFCYLRIIVIHSFTSFLHGFLSVPSLWMPYRHKLVE